MLQNWYGALSLLVCGRGRVQIGEPMPSGMKLSPVLVQTRDPAARRLPDSFFQEAISFTTGIWVSEAPIIGAPGVPKQCLEPAA